MTRSHAFVEGVGEVASCRADEDAGSGRDEGTSSSVADEDFFDGEGCLVDGDGGTVDDEASGDIRRRRRQLSQIAEEADADAEFLLGDDGLLVLDAGIDAGDAVFVAHINLLVMQP